MLGRFVYPLRDLQESKLRNPRIIAVVIGVPLLVATLACGGTSDSRGPGLTSDKGSAAPAGKTDAKKDHQITYEVAGTAGSANNISYGIGGNMSQANGTKLPWTKQAASADSFLILSLTAQSAGSSGTITCKVTVDGKVIAENSSEGQYAVVSCSGTSAG